MKKIGLFFLFLSFFITGFGCLKKKTNTDIFYERLDKNVEHCSKPLMELLGIDSIKAKEICECSMKKAFHRDSTAFVSADIERLKEIISERVGVVIGAT
ncbi:MAG: hypothetical protein LUE98_16645, partial [Tannerellaceae bacterium]|nr:hypothetical protein [Tannerellaceae bacterium]